MQKGILAAVLIFLYMIFLLFLGFYAHRKARNSRLDYFLASRRFGGLILFFSILGTIASAFTVMGFPGEVYRTGLANFGSIGGSTILLIPITFATVGLRMWKAATEFDHITPAQLLNHRYDSKYLGAIISLFMMVWTVPYLVLGGIGGGIAFESLTNGIIGYQLGAGLLLLVVTLYLILGGMRGSAYTDIIQGTLMLSLMAGFTAFVVLKLGGFGPTMKLTATQNPGLISRGASFGTKIWLSILLMIGLNALMYPHTLMRLFSSKSSKSLKKMTLLFPTGQFFLLFFSAILGFLGVSQIPGLTGQAADNILPELLNLLAPEAIASTALLVILAAIMSSLDSQIFSVSALISEDFLRDIFGLNDKRILGVSKLLTSIIMVGVFVLTVIRPGTIYFLVEFAFQGYALLFYPLSVGFYWKKSTEKGIFSGLIAGFTGLWLFQLGILPSSWTFGFMPLIPLMVVQITVTNLVSHYTEEPPDKRINSYFDVFEGLW